MELKDENWNKDEMAIQINPSRGMKLKINKCLI